METLIVTTLTDAGPEQAAEQIIAELRQKLGGRDPALVMLFASTRQPLAQVNPRVSQSFRGAAVLGASTSGEFTEQTRNAKGAVAAIAVAGDYKVYCGIGTGLAKDPDAAVRQAIEGFPDSVAGYPHRTAILLLDPLAGNGEETTLIAAQYLGESVRLAGGAAGDDLKMKQTHVASGDRVATDAVVIASIFSKQPLGVGVCHGHRPLSAPLKVTRAVGNVVKEIDGRPAWDVWVDRTRESAAERKIDPARLEEDEVGGYLLRYEAGLASGSEYKIRAPLSRNADGSLAFACAIPEGAEIQITESMPQRQVESAREAARRARAQLGSGRPAGAIVFDCICRNLILTDEFSKAVDGMSQELGSMPLAGFETYGEIALDVGDMSGFHNTTTVVLAFPK
jgi:methyl-accepting chemotaxis protein